MTMSTGKPGDRPCFNAGTNCSDCDGLPNSCSVNFCVDLGIRADTEPSQEQLQSLHVARIVRQSEWIRKEYGYTNKSEFIQNASEKVLQKTKASELQKYLMEACWQIAHLESVVTRISEDYADLTLIAEQMGDAMLANRNISMRIAQTVLSDWMAFKDWLYDEPEIENPDDDQT